MVLKLSIGKRWKLVPLTLGVAVLMTCFSWTEYGGSDMWPWRTYHKRDVAFSLLCPLHHLFFSHKDTQEVYGEAIWQRTEATCSQELDWSILPTPGEWATWGVDPPVPVKPSDGCNSTNSWIATSWKALRQNHTAKKLSTSWLRETLK